MFEAIILAGGLGTRLKEVSGDTPKPLMDVSGKPFIYHLMEELVAHGCRKIVLSLGFNADFFIDKVTKDHPVDCLIEFSVEAEPLGTGGAIKKALEFTSDERVMVLNGDSYCSLNYNQFASTDCESDILMAAVKVGSVSRYGAVKFSNDLVVESFTEKGRQGSGYINAGVYLLRRKLILDIVLDKFSFETHILQCQGNAVKVFPIEGSFIDIGIPEDYFKACKIIK